MKLGAFLASVAFLSVSCGDEPDLSTTEAPLLKDGNNAGGTPGFYFLGSYGNPPNPFPGTFDAGFKSQMSFEVHHLANCNNLDNPDGVFASFPSPSAVLVYTPPQSATSYYYWAKNAGPNNGQGLNLTQGHCYRLIPKLSGTALGYSDIHYTNGTAASGYKKVTFNSNIQVSMRLETSLRTDTDSDGVADWRDNCPTVANPTQTDSDQDGLGDACDVTDADGDGVPDGQDNCPDTHNPLQSNADDDARGDACETCVNDPNKFEPGSCGCGVADTDTDGDGTPDCNDLCPNDPNKALSAGQCGCGTPETDSDDDGLPNCMENCDPFPT